MFNYVLGKKIKKNGIFGILVIFDDFPVVRL